MTNNVEYSIIIPVYNSDSSLIELNERIKNVFKNIINKSYELIFIDDGSDNIYTWDVLEKLSNENNKVTVIQLMRNFGKSSALICGFSFVKGKFVIIMDDDLQHLPEDIPLLLKQREHDIVIAEFKQKKHSIFKRVSSRIKGWFDYKLIGKPKHIKNSAFILVKREVINAINKLNILNPFLSALLFYITKDIVNVTCNHGDRQYGKSGYTLSKLLKQFSNLIINNSSLLLRVVAYIGVSFSLISFILIVYYAYRYFVIDISLFGWHTIITLVLFIGGLILFSVGIIGEYLIRIISGVEKKPPYIIRDKIFGKNIDAKFE